LNEKFLRLKSDKSWKGSQIPAEIFTEDTALMLSDIEIEQFANENDLHCKIFINPKKYVTHSASSFVFQKDFALKEVIDHHLLKLEQAGLLKHVSQKYIKQIYHDCQPPFRELSFQATIFTFVVLATGVVIAIVTLTVEKLFYHFHLLKHKGD
jgi:hypothetical protein